MGLCGKTTSGHVWHHRKSQLRILQSHHHPHKTYHIVRVEIATMIRNTIVPSRHPDTAQRTLRRRRCLETSVPMRQTTGDTHARRSCRSTFRRRNVLPLPYRQHRVCTYRFCSPQQPVTALSKRSSDHREATPSGVALKDVSVLFR